MTTTLKVIGSFVFVQTANSKDSTVLWDHKYMALYADQSLIIRDKDLSLDEDVYSAIHLSSVKSIGINPELSNSIVIEDRHSHIKIAFTTATDMDMWMECFHRLRIQEDPIGR